MWPSWVFLAMWIVAGLLALGIVTQVGGAAISDLRALVRSWRTRRLIRGFHAEDAETAARRQREAGWPGDRPDLYGESLIGSIRVRYDGLPAKGRR